MNPGTDRDAGARTDLILFVTGNSPRSRRARTNLARAVEQTGNDTIHIRHIDLLEDTDGVREYGIFATPALIHVHEDGDSAVLYGDLSNEPELQRFLADIGGQVRA